MIVVAQFEGVILRGRGRVSQAVGHRDLVAAGVVPIDCRICRRSAVVTVVKRLMLSYAYDVVLLLASVTAIWLPTPSSV